MNNRERAQSSYQSKLDAEYIQLEERLKSKILEMLPEVEGITFERHFVASLSFTAVFPDFWVTATLEGVPELYFYLPVSWDGLCAATREHKDARWDIESWVDVGGAIACVTELAKQPKEEQVEDAP